MRSVTVHRLALCAGLLCCLAANLFGSAAVQDALTDDLEQALATIRANAETSKRPVPPVVMSEPAVNAYLRHVAALHESGLVDDPSMTFTDGGRIALRVTVDLGALGSGRGPVPLGPLPRLDGRVPMTAAGVLSTDAGTGRFAIEQVTLAGFPVPAVMLQMLVQRLTTSDVYPTGIDVNEPFALPYRILEVRVEAGALVVEQ